MNAFDRYDSLFQFYGETLSVPWQLLKAQAHVESGLNPAAMSPRGAEGLAQFMPTTWREWGYGDIRNPEQAIEAQSKYMHWLLVECEGDVRMALAAYNWGIGKVKRLGDQCAPKETKEYVRNVMERFGGTT